MLDVTHLVPAQDVRRGSVVLAQTVPYLPPAVHVAVVDPGVGTDRRAIVVDGGATACSSGRTTACSWRPRRRSAARWRPTSWQIRRCGRARLSATFHGRDLFVPAAARFATGVEPEAAGPAVPVADLVRLPVPLCRVRPGLAETEVLTVDGFGNRAAGVARGTGWPRPASGSVTGCLVSVAGRAAPPLAVPVVATFASVPAGEPLLYVDSAGMLALAVNRGSASRQLDIGAGALVRLSAPAGIVSSARPPAS